MIASCCCSGHSRGEQQALDSRCNSVDCVFIPSVILNWTGRVRVGRRQFIRGPLSACDLTNEHTLMPVLVEIASNQLGKSAGYKDIGRLSNRQY